MKYIWNLPFWLYSCTASNPPSLLWDTDTDTIQNTLCKCSWSDAIVSKVMSGFRQKWRKVLASCGGLLRKMEVGENVHEDVLIWNLKVIKVESPDHDNNIMVPFVEVWSNKEKPMSTVPLPNWWLDRSRYNGFHINILAHWSDPMLDLLLMIDLSPQMPDQNDKLG